MTRDDLDKFVKRLCKAIRGGRFNYENYLCGGTWYGQEISTMPMFVSYGQCGFSVGGRHIPEISWDWEMRELLVDDMPLKEWLEYED